MTVKNFSLRPSNGAFENDLGMSWLPFKLMHFFTM